MAGSTASFWWRVLAGGGGSARGPRGRGRADVPVCEVLEGRVVLSHFGGPGGLPGGSLLGSLAQVGVIATPGGPDAGPGGWGQSTQLQTDLTKLRTDLSGLAAKSAVTVADLAALAGDEQAIAASGFRPDPTALRNAVGAIATAVAGNADQTQAKSDFAAVFAGSTLSPAAVDKAYADVVQAVTDSKVTPDDLTLIAADQANVQNDLTSTTGRGFGGRGPRGLGGDFGGFGGFGRGGGALLGSLNQVGVLTASAQAGDGHIGGPWGSTSGTLQTDMTTLQTALSGLAAKSGVTVADLAALQADAQALAAAGARPDPAALGKAVGEIASAVAGGSDQTQAKADFTAVFASTSVTQAAIDKAYADVVQAVADSKVTPTDLSNVAADRAAVQADLNALKPVYGPARGPGATTGSAGTTTGSATPPGPGRAHGRFGRRASGRRHR